MLFELSFIEKNCLITTFFSLNNLIRLKRDDRDNEAKNKNNINEESEKASCHETNYCYYKYDNDWYVKYELLTNDYYHYY